MNLKNNVTEEVASAAKEVVKEKIREILAQEVEGEIFPSLKNDSEVQEATKELYEDTSSLLQRNKNNIHKIAKKIIEYGVKTIDNAKDNIIRHYKEYKNLEVNKQLMKDKSKIVIIDVRTGAHEDYENYMRRNINFKAKVEQTYMQVIDQDFTDIKKQLYNNKVGLISKLKNKL